MIQSSIQYDLQGVFDKSKVSFIEPTLRMERIGFKEASYSLSKSKDFDFIPFFFFLSFMIESIYSTLSLILTIFFGARFVVEGNDTKSSLFLSFSFLKSISFGSLRWSFARDDAEWSDFKVVANSWDLFVSLRWSFERDDVEWSEFEGVVSSWDEAFDSCDTGFPRVTISRALDDKILTMK